MAALINSLTRSSSSRRRLTSSEERDELIITPLGAGNEVGRFCVYMSYKAFTWTMLLHYHIFWQRLLTSITLEVNGIRFWCYTAGHVLGAAMFVVDIAGVHVLYTGDYSREEDRHIRAAELPQLSPDVCIIESTYGVQSHQSGHTREKQFTEVIHDTVSQGGRVLIPAFALGRAQELLLILDELWSSHPELHNVPIYYASPLAKGVWRFTRPTSIL